MNTPGKSALAADAVLVAHALFVLFAVFGAFLVALHPWVALVHIPAVAWSSFVNLRHKTCPLTPLEQQLRVKAGQASFEGSWLQNYIEPWLRPKGMPRKLELVAGVSILVWNAIVYGSILLWGNIS